MFRVLFFLASFVCAAMSVFLLWHLLPVFVEAMYDQLSRPEATEDEANEAARAFANLMGNWIFPAETFMLGLLGFGGMAWVWERFKEDDRWVDSKRIESS